MGKLLFFASDFRIGLSALLSDQLIALHRSGINLCAVAGEQEQEVGLTRKVNETHVPLHRIEGLDEHKNFKKLSDILARIVVNEHIDIVHVQNNWQLALIVYIQFKLLFRKKIKVIYTLHGFRHNNLWKSRVAQFVIGVALFLFADKIICMCGYLKNKFILLSYKIELMPLGITEHFFQSKYAILPTNGLQMIFPAQFRKGKNQDVIIRAFAKYLAETGDLTSHLTLPGTGSLQKEMKELTTKLGLADRIDFPGQCTKEKIYQLYQKSNIGIVSSNSETFGQSIVEPFVLGKCVLSTPVGIALDIIHNGDTGYLFTNEEELYNILISLYQNPHLISDIGQNNFKQRDQFRWNKICIDYKKRFID